MSLHGTAALAMWWDMAPEMKSEFEHWHSHEHFPERLGVPGFLRASRWTSATGGDGIFVLYELASHAVLSSDAYLRHLNTPTPWSVRMMPHHRNMVRSQCHVLESSGSGTARHASTLRLTPPVDRVDELIAFFREHSAAWTQRPGIVGAHLLRHEKPDIAETTEQRIRKSADRFADWVFVGLGYEAEALHSLLQSVLSAMPIAAFEKSGARSDFYTLSHSATAEDIGRAASPASRRTP